MKNKNDKKKREGNEYHKLGNKRNIYINNNAIEKKKMGEYAN